MLNHGHSCSIACDGSRVSTGNGPGWECGESDCIDEDSDIWYEDNVWAPPGEEVDYEEEQLAHRAHRTKALSMPSGILPSTFTAGVFRMPREDGRGYEPFSFEGRRHMVQVYDTPARKILLQCGRQVEKSTLLGNKAITSSVLTTALRILYVSPSSTQTKTFSNDRIKEPIETSPLLTKFTTTMLAKNVLKKQFINRSMITLRYAYLNADRCRGIPASQLYMDEIQNILRDNIPVIEHCLSHASPMFKLQVYSGTPLSLDNIIEHYRANMSTQGEWVVPCEGCNNWNILGEKNLGKKGPICSKCGKIIHPQGPRAQWAWMIKPDPTDPSKTPWESYRIPQIMTPWKLNNWSEVIYDYEHHPRDKFMNECMGISWESGTRPLTKAQLREACGTHSLYELDKTLPLSHAQPFFMGIDWGPGDKSYTVVTVGTYIEDRFRILFMTRFIGEDADPAVQIAKILEMVQYFNIKIVGADYGYGFGLNNRLVNALGANRVHAYQYVDQQNRKIVRNTELGRWTVHRTEIMTAMFTAIKRKRVEFFKWDEMDPEFSKDFTSIYSEYNERRGLLHYDHKQASPDDSFHSFTYCMLASMILIPRPDILTPSEEDSDGVPVRRSTGPINQG